MLQKTSIEGLYRDVESNSLINTNEKALLSYKHNKQKAREFSIIKNKVEKIEKQIIEINETIKILLEKSRYLDAN